VDSGADALISRLRLGSAASRAAALEELAGTAAALPAPAAAAAVSAVAALLDSAGGDLLPSSCERAVAVLAAFASSGAACRFLAEEAGAVVPHLCRALESGVRAARLPDRAMAARPPSWPHAPAQLASRARTARLSGRAVAGRRSCTHGHGAGRRRRRGAARAGSGRRGAARASAWIGDNGDVRSGAHLSATETSQNCDGMALKGLE